MRAVPKSFDLLGHTITVVIREDLLSECDCYGRWTRAKQLIELQEVNSEVTQSFQLQTFWHEVAHAILDHIGEDKQSEDEKYVDLWGQCIHQVLKTKRGK